MKNCVFKENSNKLHSIITATPISLEISASSLEAYHQARNKIGDRIINMRIFTVSKWNSGSELNSMPKLSAIIKKWRLERTTSKLQHKIGNLKILLKISSRSKMIAVQVPAVNLISLTTLANLEIMCTNGFIRICLFWTYQEMSLIGKRE